MKNSIILTPPLSKDRETRHKLGSIDAALKQMEKINKQNQTAEAIGTAQVFGLLEQTLTQEGRKRRNKEAFNKKFSKLVVHAPTRQDRPVPDTFEDVVSKMFDNPVEKLDVRRLEESLTQKLAKDQSHVKISTPDTQVEDVVCKLNEKLIRDQKRANYKRMGMFSQLLIVRQSRLIRNRKDWKRPVDIKYPISGVYPELNYYRVIKNVNANKKNLRSIIPRVSRGVLVYEPRLDAAYKYYTTMTTRVRICIPGCNDKLYWTTPIDWILGRVVHEGTGSVNSEWIAFNTNNQSGFINWMCVKGLEIRRSLVGILFSVPTDNIRQNVAGMSDLTLSTRRHVALFNPGLTVGRDVKSYLSVLNYNAMYKGEIHRGILDKVVLRRVGATINKDTPGAISAEVAYEVKGKVTLSQEVITNTASLAYQRIAIMKLKVKQSTLSAERGLPSIPF